jgi:hypothetical protein
MNPLLNLDRADLLETRNVCLVDLLQRREPLAQQIVVVVQPTSVSDVIPSSGGSIKLDIKSVSAAPNWSAPRYDFRHLTASSPLYLQCVVFGGSSTWIRQDSRSWKIKKVWSAFPSDGFHYGSFYDDACGYIFPERHEQFSRECYDGSLLSALCLRHHAKVLRLRS